MYIFMCVYTKYIVCAHMCVCVLAANRILIDQWHQLFAHQYTKAQLSLISLIALVIGFRFSMYTQNA